VPQPHLDLPFSTGGPLWVGDCEKPGSAYLLTWGRRHSQDTLNRLAERLDTDVFVLGHQAQPKGWCRAGDNLLILASDHNHGCLLEFDLAQSYTAEELAADNLLILASDHNHGCLLEFDLAQSYTAEELAARTIPLASLA